MGALKSSPLSRVVKIGRGTHLLRLERNRYALYREAQTFLEGGDLPNSPKLIKNRPFLSRERIMNRSQIMERPVVPEIPGYDYETDQVPRAPVTPEELRKLEEAVVDSS